MSIVGIIANPAAGKDIRRLVAHGRFVPNNEKVNILRRVLAGLAGASVERVVMMPDTGMLCHQAASGSQHGIDGKPAYACSILAIQVQGKDIRTVEGLAQGDRLHPIQQAFVDNDAQQCGYCTPGFVMACKAFLDKNPNPTLDQVRTGLGGNLCRCGTYVGVAQAVLQSSESQTGSLVVEGRNHA